MSLQRYDHAPPLKPVLDGTHNSVYMAASGRLAFQSLGVALQTTNARNLRSRKAIVSLRSLLPQPSGSASWCRDDLKKHVEMLFIFILDESGNWGICICHEAKLVPNLAHNIEQYLRKIEVPWNPVPASSWSIFQALYGACACRTSCDHMASFSVSYFALIVAIALLLVQRRTTSNNCQCRHRRYIVKRQQPLVLPDDKTTWLSPHAFFLVTNPRCVLLCIVAQTVSGAAVTAAVCPAGRDIIPAVGFSNYACHKKDRRDVKTFFCPLANDVNQQRLILKNVI
jgi:hypothetical protein